MNTEPARRTVVPVLDHPDAKPPVMALLPLAVALALMVVMTILPMVATDAHGNAHHPAALLIFWAMSAGFSPATPAPWRWRSRCYAVT